MAVVCDFCGEPVLANERALKFRLLVTDNGLSVPAEDLGNWREDIHSECVAPWAAAASTIHGTRPAH